MRKTTTRPKLRVHAHYGGAQPLADAYADVFAMMLQKQRGAKSSIRTFDSRKQFHYDRKHKERDSDGS